MDLLEIVFERVDWIHLAVGRDRCWVLVETVNDKGFLGKPERLLSF